ncbi:AAA family ATPase [Streptomyces sp. RKCA744]|uniref:helix-turn-helix transcriptional regulator n=1 Tax=Streptomyces sp. RKCA744 TaxID=2959340 RepID=UPI0027E2DE7E|nr:AAA family ATPase [Streptomyces sp. RKCA744]
MTAENSSSIKRNPHRVSNSNPRLSRQLATPQRGLMGMGPADYESELRDVLGMATRGDGGLLQVVGGPGVGKTSLLGSLKERAVESGAVCLTASGFADEVAIPFNVVEQLIRSSGSLSALDVVARWRTAGERYCEDEHGILRNLVREISDILHGIAGGRQLIIAVDDAEHADYPSLMCLMHIARHACGTRTLVAVTCGQPHQPCSRFLSFQNLYKIEIEALPESEVGHLLQRQSDAGLADRIRASAHRVSGGNPRLVKALLRDHRKAAADAAERDITVGTEFQESYRRCLLRHQALLRVAQALAVLDPYGSPRRVAELLECDEERVTRAIGILGSAGLLDAGRFRHPAARAVALEELTAEDRSRLSAKAAALLYHDGADPSAVAEFLVAAGGTPDQKGVTVLWRAALKNMDDGRIEEAIACLRLAARADLGRWEHLDIHLTLIGALWSSNPAAAEPELDRLMGEVRTGSPSDIPQRYLCILLFLVLWFGRSGDSEEVFAWLSGSSDAEKPSDPAAVRVTRQWVTFLKPALIPDFPGKAGPDAEFNGLWAANLEHGLHFSVDELGMEIGYPQTPGPAGDFPADTMHLVSPSHHFWFAYAYACRIVWALVARGETDTADRLCEALFAAADRLNMKVPCAVAQAMRAYIRYRHGDFTSAIDLAGTALRSLPPRGWGVTIGLPLSVLVAANTAIGRLEEAQRYLRYWVPKEMFDSVVGLEYLRARGHYCLATNRPYAALNDFVLGGKLLEKWPVEFGDLAPWRIDAAEAYLSVQEPADAKRLALEELSLSPDRPLGVRGRALRVLAMAEDPDKRRLLLYQSAKCLRDHGDRFELARTLTELSHDFLSTGETQQARTAWHEVQKLMDECGISVRREDPRGLLVSGAGTPPAAGPSQEAEQTGDGDAGTPPEDPGTPAGAAEQPVLSEAEWRVATLAASGMTNRQVAKSLYITVSTVEQHLTRVYRKLSVGNRQDLSHRLWLLIGATGQSSCRASGSAR